MTPTLVGLEVGREVGLEVGQETGALSTSTWPQIALVAPALGTQSLALDRSLFLAT